MYQAVKGIPKAQNNELCSLKTQVKQINHIAPAPEITRWIWHEKLKKAWQKQRWGQRAYGAKRFHTTEKSSYGVYTLDTF